MTAIEKFMGISFTLIALYLIIANASGFNTVVTSLASGVGSVDKTLQGR